MPSIRQSDEEEARKKEQARRRRDAAPLTSCDTCFYFDCDEAGDYDCQLGFYMDEDERLSLRQGKSAACPYYKYYDEYMTVRKQN